MQQYDQCQAFLLAQLRQSNAEVSEGRRFHATRIASVPGLADRGIDDVIERPLPAEDDRARDTSCVISELRAGGRFTAERQARSPVEQLYLVPQHFIVARAVDIPPDGCRVELGYAGDVSVFGPKILLTYRLRNAIRVRCWVESQRRSTVGMNTPAQADYAYGQQQYRTEHPFEPRIHAGCLLRRLRMRRNRATADTAASAAHPSAIAPTHPAR